MSQPAANHSLLLKIIMITLTTAITALVCEGAFRVYLSFVNIHDMEMHKYARQLKQRSEVPGLHHEHIPNGSAKLMGVQVQTNGLGFRSIWQPEEVSKDESRVSSSAIPSHWDGAWSFQRCSPRSLRKP